MKIAILSCFYPYRGGIAQFNANIYSELGKSHDVRAYNFTRQYPSLLFPGKTQYVSDKDSAKAIPGIRVLDSINPLSYHKSAATINEWNPDILITRYWNSFFAPSLGYVARHMCANTKKVSIIDNIFPHERRFFDYSFARYFLNSNDGFIVLSESVKEDLFTINPNVPVKVIPHPIYNHFGEKICRDSACQKLGIDPSSKNILFFGLIREYKGLDILIEAFSNLDSSYNLIIAGEPYESFEKYNKLIENSPNRANIKLFTDYIPDSEVSLFFSSADVVVLPYKTATQSGISAICYHFEVPMITTDVGGLKEAIEKPGTGIVVQYPAAEYIVQGIKEYFESNHKELYTKNIQVEKERHSWTNFSKELINFTKSL